MSEKKLVQDGDKMVSMTTLLIAELTGKRHKTVMADVDRMLKTFDDEAIGCVVGTHEDEDDYFCAADDVDVADEDRGIHYILDKTACLVLAAGYDYEHRKNIEDSWPKDEIDEETPDYEDMTEEQRFKLHDKLTRIFLKTLDERRREHILIRAKLDYLNTRQQINVADMSEHIKEQAAVIAKKDILLECRANEKMLLLQQLRNKDEQIEKLRQICSLQEAKLRAKKPDEHCTVVSFLKRKKAKMPISETTVFDEIVTRYCCKHKLTIVASSEVLHDKKLKAYPIDALEECWQNF